MEHPHKMENFCGTSCISFKEKIILHVNQKSLSCSNSVIIVVMATLM